MRSASVLTHILNRVHRWGDLGKMKSFVKQTEIKIGLDESYRELRACSMRFNVRAFLQLPAWSRNPFIIDRIALGRKQPKQRTRRDSQA